MTLEGTFDGSAVVSESKPVPARQWLVSVRSRRELSVALKFQVAGHTIDIVDLKEPRDGPLAPVSIRLWTAAARMCRQLVDVNQPKPMLSAALGEKDQAVKIASQLPPDFKFAKAGPSGCRSIDEVIDLWRSVGDQLPKATHLVAVAYADHDSASSCDPESIFAAASRSGIRHCLIDTFTKDGRSTLDYLGVSRLSRLSSLASELGLYWALAGSIRIEQIATLDIQQIQPHCVGVRGGVCDDGRGGNLSIEKLGRWSESLRSRLQ